ncbi:cupin domain-containing protein [Herbidospora daliensis]|uniref:cupin domain-containing protein n=1 Tax=Herbidospora daliensis TaxID=295585 RepID=UPI0007812AF8|nr:cupin domain-containing protein [Herbidospora daliensis]
MRIIEGAGVWAGGGDDWTEHLRTPDLSVGTYCIPAGGLDDQSPHTEDEIYVVTTGRARIVTPTGEAQVGPGAVIFVPAGEDHRFVDVTEDLTLLVVFGPAYGSRGGT